MGLKIYKRIEQNITYLIQDPCYDAEMILAIEIPIYDDEPILLRYYLTASRLDWYRYKRTNWLDIFVVTGVTEELVQKLYYVNDVAPDIYMDINEAVKLNRNLNGF